MAFLCPVRIRRGKRKSEEKDKVGGRITGSASLDTLVKVDVEKENGFTSESKMVVLHDFTPCVDDELEVKRGQHIHVLYKENDWVYVVAEDKHEGFIPHSYCAPYGSSIAELASNIKHKKLPPKDEKLKHRAQSSLILKQSDVADTNIPNKSESKLVQEQLVELHQNPYSNIAGIHPFVKEHAGQYLAIYTFTARDENDLTVDRGELVTVLNREDPDWFWVVRSDGQEGFVPNHYIFSMDVTQDMVGLKDTCLSSTTSVASQSLSPSSEDYRGNELVILFDYKAQANDDLTVHRGEWVYADLSQNNTDGWIWAYAPKSRKNGFIPKNCIRLPAMTAL